MGSDGTVVVDVVLGGRQLDMTPTDCVFLCESRMHVSNQTIGIERRNVTGLSRIEFVCRTVYVFRFGVRSITLSARRVPLYERTRLVMLFW